MRKSLFFTACFLLMSAGPVFAEAEVADAEAVEVPRRSMVLHVPPSEAQSGRQVKLVAVVDAAWTEATLVARYRVLGSTDAYGTSPFERSSAGGYYAVIPGEAVGRPGIEYYIAGQLADGRETIHFASAKEPHGVVVEPTPHVRWAEKEQRRLGGHLSSVAVDVRGHNFGNRYGERDQYIRGDMEFSHRLLLPRLYSISLGFGLLEGYTPDGGSDQAIARKQGARYGYAGFRLRLHDSVWVDSRVSMGVSRTGFIVGAGGQVTFGRPWRSNLQLGGEIMDDVGPTVWARLQWDTVPQFLMGAAIVKTDVPNATLSNGSFIVYDVTYPVTPRFQVRGSLSFGSRDGPGNFGGGLGTSFTF